MSLAILDVPLRDTAVEQLRIAFDGQVSDTFCEAVTSHPDGTTPPLIFGALGASYVVLVDKRENSSFTEEVSCTTPHGTPLSGTGVMVRTHAENLSPEAFTQRANTLRYEFRAGYPHLVVAEFPDFPGVLTALSAEPIEQGYRWDTRHGYPPGQLVWMPSTWTTVVDIYEAEANRIKGGS